ncbi:hypothetical protein MI149_29930 (plasmid) [Mycolicibacterium crocinum]|uniref:Secreted protein n=1 Tax=Mycolicibacterium crocinum TaxID=388459 RepID=A0ABY3TTD0_9MYCO|nr:hypothetical protein [Mycolicibacterium crocinum]ULN44716.1 hypothetical protein MI149_29930 [Mycolicibacterium crocinum]
MTDVVDRLRLWSVCRILGVSVRIGGLILIRGIARWCLAESEFVCEGGGFIAHLLDKLATIALDEDPILGGDYRDLCGRNSARGIQVLLDFLMGGVVRVTNVSFGETNVFAEPPLGGSNTVEHIDDPRVCIVFGRIMNVGSFFAVAFSPMLREHLVGLPLSLTGRFLVTLAELLQLGLSLGKFGFGLGRPHAGPDQIACERTRLEMDIASTGHPKRWHIVVRHRGFGGVKDLQQLGGF